MADDDHRHMPVLIAGVEFSIHRSAKGFRAGFKGFESSMFRLKDSERCAGSSGACGKGTEMMVRASISGPCIGTRHLVLFLTGLGKVWWNHSSKFSTFGQGVSPAARKALDNNRVQQIVADDVSRPLTSIQDTETGGPYRPTAERRTLTLRLCSAIKSMRASPLGCQFEGFSRG